MSEYMALIMFLAVCLVLLAGFPVAFSLGGTALAFAWLGHLTGTFDDAFLHQCGGLFKSHHIMQCIIKGP